MIADDDTADKELFRDALIEANLQFDLEEVSNGEELINYLGEVKQLPHIIFLDLNMPIMDGRAALLEIRKSNQLKEIPVIVLSTSNNSVDVKLSYRYGANLYFTKQDSFTTQVNMLKELFNVIKGYTLLPN